MKKVRAIASLKEDSAQSGIITSGIKEAIFSRIESHIVLKGEIVEISAEIFSFAVGYYAKIAEETNRSLDSVLHGRLQHIVYRLGIETEEDLYGESGHRYNLLSVIEELQLCAINRSDRILRAIEDEGINALEQMGYFLKDREAWKRSIPHPLNFISESRALDAHYDLYRDNRHLIEGTPFGFDRRGYLLFFSEEDPSKSKFARALGFLIEKRKLASLENEGLLVIEKRDA